MQRLVLILTLIGFAALSTVALWQYGYVAIFTMPLQTSAGTQVFVDLVIALTLFLVWMWRDAKMTGRNPWPWTIITLTLGSFGPLLYLLTSKTRQEIPG